MKKTIIIDLLAGLTVSFAALSLGAAFGVMSGRGAFAGMLGAAVIPIITSLFGGTRVQASGPTAPMTAITALVVAYAYEHFSGSKELAEQFITLIILMSSAFIILAGVVRLGKFIALVPNVVVLGFMNGIAVLIWVDQLKKLFGLAGKTAIGGGILTNSIIAFGCLGMIYFFPMLFKKIGIPEKIRRFLPSIFITILLLTTITSITSIDVARVDLGSSVSSIDEFIALVTSYFPTDSALFTWELLSQAIPFALQLCLLAYLDSLLTALVVDKMTKEKSKYNKELIAQGLANGLSGLLQGIPGAQATIRSVLLIKEGAQNRIAGVFVGVFALLGFLVFSNLIVLITSAVFVGVLFKAGLDVLDRDFPIAYFKNKWFKSKVRNIQFLFIIYTTLVTVIVDLNVAVFSGTILFYIGKKFFGVIDAEDDYEEVHSDNLLGQEVEA